MSGLPKMRGLNCSGYRRSMDQGNIIFVRPVIQFPQVGKYRTGGMEIARRMTLQGIIGEIPDLAGILIFTLNTVTHNLPFDSKI